MVEHVPTKLSPLTITANWALDKIVREANKLPDGQLKRFESLMLRRRDINLFISEKASGIAGTEAGQGDSKQSESGQRLMVIGGMFLHSEVLDRMYALDKDSGYKEAVRDPLEVLRKIISPTISLSLRGRNIASFVKEKHLMPIQAIDYLSVFTDFLVSTKADQIRPIYEENSSYPLSLVPTYLEEQVEITALAIQAMIASSPHISRFSPAGSKNIEREAWFRVRRVFSRTAEYTELLRGILYEPKKEHFKNLREILEVYLSTSPEAANAALYSLGLVTPDRIFGHYGKARGLSLEGIEPDFYGLLADGISYYSDQLAVDRSIITNSRLAEVYVRPEDAEVPTTGLILDGLRDPSEAIIQQSDKREFEAADIPGNEHIDTRGFVRPQVQKVSIGPKDPGLVSIDIWLGPDGKRTPLALRYNLDAHEMRWNMLPLVAENPDLFKILAHSALGYTMDLLGLIRNQAALPGTDPIDLARPPAAGGYFTNRVVRARTAYMEIHPATRKAERKKMEGKTSADVNGPFKHPQTPGEKGIRNEICITEEELAKLRKVLSPDEFRALQEKIAKVNSSGVIELTPLDEANGQGRLYSARVFGSRRGDNRCLLEVLPESERGIRRMRVLIVGNREQIYTKAKREGLIKPKIKKKYKGQKHKR